MRKLLVLLALVPVLAIGCSGDGSKGNSESSASSVPDWLDQFADAEVTTSTVLTGRTFYVDEENRTLYVKGDCDKSEAGVSQPGDPFGPSERDAEGNFTPGYATVCVD